VWPKIVVKRTNGSHEVQPKATQMRSASSESWTSEHLGLPHQYEEALKCVKDEVFQQEFALFVQKLRTKEAENKPPQVIVREVPRKRRGFFPNLWAYESTFWDPWVGGAH